jgi:hypothetical protein
MLAKLRNLSVLSKLSSERTTPILSNETNEKQKEPFVEERILIACEEPLGEMSQAEIKREASKVSLL